VAATLQTFGGGTTDFILDPGNDAKPLPNTPYTIIDGVTMLPATGLVNATGAAVTQLVSDADGRYAGSAMLEGATYWLDCAGAKGSFRAGPQVSTTALANVVALGPQLDSIAASAAASAFSAKQAQMAAESATAPAPAAIDAHLGGNATALLDGAGNVQRARVPDLSDTFASVAAPALNLAPGADNTAAILAARAVAIARGVPLWLPAGTWRMSDVLVGWNGGRIIGHGATLDILTDHSATGRGVYSYGVADFAIEGLTVTQSNGSGRNGVYGLISFLTSGGTGCSAVALRGVRTKGGESAGVFASKLTDFDFNGVRVSNTYADGIHISRGSTDGQIRGARVANVGDDAIAVVSVMADQGVTYAQCEGISIDSPIVRGTTPLGGGVAFIGAKDSSLTGGLIYDCFDAGVKITNDTVAGTHTPSDVKVVGTTVRGCADGFRVGVSTDVVIANATSISNRGLGFALIGSTRTLVSGGRARGNGDAGIYASVAGSNAIGVDLRGNTGGAAVGAITATNCVTA